MAFLTFVRKDINYARENKTSDLPVCVSITPNKQSWYHRKTNSIKI